MPAILEMTETGAGSLPTGPSAVPQRAAASLAIYALTIFLSAALLFQVQLIFAKHILPFFGGVPSVWNTCMFCFQVLLLLGYSYAHLLKTRFTLHQQRILHCFLLLASAVVLVVLWFHWGTPLTPGPQWKPGANDNPVRKILQLLSLTVAFPFFMMSTTGPLLQSWVARTRALSSPYRLYALSNVGSLLGLLTYPFLLEWSLTIRHQAWIWSSTYLLFVVLCLLIASRLPREAAVREVFVSRAELAASRPKTGRYVLWLAFSTCSTVILLSSTNFLCENIAAVPLLWVLPLSLYLLTFMLAFNSPRWYSRRIFWPLYAAAVGIVLSSNLASYLKMPLLLIGLHCLAIFAVCMVCHGELARSRPAAEHLTSFYWMIAAGGALGGTFVVLIAPQILRNFWEFHGALLACGLLLFGSAIAEDPAGQREAATWPPVLAVLIAFLLPHLGYMLPRLGRFPLINREYWTLPLCFGLWLLFRAAFPRQANSNEAPAQGSIPSSASNAASASSQFAWPPIAAFTAIALFGILFCSYSAVVASRLPYLERNFFGVKYVSETPDSLSLISGSTVHGMQLKDPAKRNIPTLYYSPQSGIGTLLQAYPRNSNNGHLRIGVIGMGIASLAAYTRPGDYLRFYEIDPAVLPLSIAPRPIFSFLQNSLGRIEISLGDARLSLERELEQEHLEHFDVLVVDAFNSDSIPVHLLTSEALALYKRHLRGSDSVLAFHLTNRYLDLVPVVRGLAERHDLAIAQVRQDSSNWIFLAANPAILQIPALAQVAHAPATHRRSLLWTDDYSNVFQVFRYAPER